MGVYKVYFANGGVPATGLSPVWNTLKNVSDGTDYTPQPSITEVGGGWYKFTFTPPNDISGAIDGTATLGDADRYVSALLTADDFNLDNTVSSVAPAVWDVPAASHDAAGSTGEALNAAGTAGDPWTTSLPGGYAPGTAGKIIGDNINAPIATVDSVVDDIKAKTDNLPVDPADESLVIAATDAVMARIGANGSGLTALGDTRIAHLDADVSSRNATTPPTVTEIRQEIDANSAKLDVAVSTRSTITAQQVWEYATRTITGGGGATAQEIWEYATRTITAGGGGATVQEIWEYATRELTTKTGFSLTSDYDAAKAAMQAGDTNVSDIKSKTDNLPVDPAAVGSAMILTTDYDAAKTASSQSSVNTANTGISAIATFLSTIISGIWTYATRKLTSAMTDEEFPQDMAATGGGAMFTGSNAVTLTVYQTDTTTPIPDVYVDVRNAAGTLSLGVIRTDLNGQSKDANGADIVMLDPAVSAGYKLYLRKPGVIFAATPLTQAEVVAGALTIYGTQFVPVIAAPGFQTVYGQLFQGDGNPAVGAIVQYAVAYANTMAEGGFFQNNVEYSTVDANGYFQLQAPFGAAVSITMPKSGTYKITVTSDPYKDLASYLS